MVLDYGVTVVQQRIAMVLFKCSSYSRYHNDSLLSAHLWAVDRNITKTYCDDVCESVNNYLRYLKNIGAIIGGECWTDGSLNTPDQIQQGKIVFDFDFTAPYPAEHITFRSRMVNNYLEEIFE